MKIEEIFAKITPDGELCLANINLHGELFRKIALNKSIKRLLLGGCGINDEDFIFFLLFNKTVKALNLSTNHLTIESIKLIPEHAVFEYLDIGDQAPQLTEECCEYFSNPHLKELNLFNSDIGDMGCFYLAQCQNLETIGLYNAGVTDMGAYFLANSKNIKQAYLAKNELTAPEEDVKIPSKVLLFYKGSKKDKNEEELAEEFYKGMSLTGE